MPIFVIFYILFTQYYTSNNTQTPTFASKYKSIIMSTFQNTAGRMTNYRWIICAMLFFATTVNYLDRQVLSLTWKDFISPEFHWTDTHYGYITAIFSIVYALGNLFAGRFIDWMGTKKGYLWAIAVWSIGACMHALCGLATEMTLGIENAANMISATGALASTIAITSVYYCLLHFHIQCRLYHRSTDSPIVYPYPGPLLPTHGRGQRLGNGFYRYRRIGFHLDGTVDIHVQET